MQSIPGKKQDRKTQYYALFCFFIPVSELTVFFSFVLIVSPSINSHTVNLLINIPTDFYEELLTPLNETDVQGVENKDIEYDGRNMEAIISLLEFLQHRLDTVSSYIRLCVCMHSCLSGGCILCDLYNFKIF